MGIGMLLTTITTIFDLLFYLRVYEYIYVSPFIFILFTNIFEDFITMRYCIIMYSVVNAKVTPHSVEASIFSLLAGCSNLGFGVLGSYHGTFWANLLNLSKDNLDNMYIAMVIKVALSFVPMLMLGLVPNKEEIENDEDLKGIN